MCVDSNTLLYELYLFIKLYSKNHEIEIQLKESQTMPS